MKLVANREVLGDRERWEGRLLLMDEPHARPVGKRGRHVARVVRRPVDLDLTGVGPIDASQNLDHRRLPRAVPA